MRANGEVRVRESFESYTEERSRPGWRAGGRAGPMIGRWRRACQGDLDEITDVMEAFPPTRQHGKTDLGFARRGLRFAWTAKRRAAYKGGRSCRSLLPSSRSISTRPRRSRRTCL